MGRTLFVAAALVSLAACGGQKSATDPPSVQPPAVSSSPSPTPPVMPALAKEHTKAGAAAFIAYFWEVVNYAQSSLDTRLLRSLANPSCAGCNGGVMAIEKIKADKGVAEGGEVAPTVFKVQPESTSSAKLMSAQVRLRIRLMTVTYPSPRESESYPASTAKDFFILSEQPIGWQVETIEVAK